MSKPRQLVIIEWYDSCGLDSRWKTIQATCEQKPIKITTVGWIIAQDRKKVIVVASISDVEHCADGCVIHRRAIEKMYKIGRPGDWQRKHAD